MTVRKARRAMLRTCEDANEKKTPVAWTGAEGGVMQSLEERRDKDTAGFLQFGYIRRESVHRVVCCPGARRHDPARRKPGGEAAAHSGRALDLQGRLVARERVLDDSEPQARATGLARAAAVDAVEPLRESRNMLRLDAYPGVLDDKLRALLRSAPDQAHLAPLRRVAHGVAREIAERAGDLRFGAEQIEARLRVERDALAPAGERPGLAVDPREQQRDVDALVARRLGRRLERGQREEVVDDALHALALLGHEVQIVPRPLGIELELPHRLQETDQDREGCAQLVGHVRDEVAAHGLEPDSLGDVAREQQALRVDVRHELHRKHQAVTSGLQLDRLGEILLGDVLDELGLAHEIRDRLADVGLGVDTEVGPAGVVAPDDARLGIEDSDAVRKGASRLSGARQRARELAALLDFRALPPVQKRKDLFPGTR